MEKFLRVDGAFMSPTVGMPLQGYALHGHVDLHTWHTHVGSTGTSAQYILPVPWSRDCVSLGIRSLDKI